MLGLCGFDPVKFPIEKLNDVISTIISEEKIKLNSELEIPFFLKENIIFNRKFLEFHTNRISFRAKLNNGIKTSSTY